MLGFSDWRSLAHLAVADLPKYGDIPAVYAMRSKRGELLYIGSTGDLRRRIFGNHLGGVGGETTKRINGLLFSAGAVADIEVAWIETAVYLEKERTQDAMPVRVRKSPWVDEALGLCKPPKLTLELPTTPRKANAESGQMVLKRGGRGTLNADTGV